MGVSNLKPEQTAGTWKFSFMKNRSASGEATSIIIQLWSGSFGVVTFCIGILHTHML
ncbi:hypothetical protein PF003_g19259 [Phytophthora fragariae]|nr:hypothetical protein PF003_g19259 [Phytophthora fragariae]